MKTLLVAQLIVGTIFLGVAAGGQAASNSAAMDTKPSGPAVTIDNFSFSPATLTVSAGTTVTWTNHDDIPHNIAERDQKFKSKALDTDESFSYTFADPGTYEYFCGLHPKMIGKIIVEAKN
jgi:plastocyanin